MSKNKLLVDGDIVLWIIAARGADIAKEFEINLDEYVEEKLYEYVEFVEEMEDTCRLKALNVFSGANNFRKDLWDGYKQNRKDKELPYGFQELREGIHKSYAGNTVSAPKLEAVDLLGLMSDKRNDIIASIDKDLLQVPGLHYDWRTASLFEVSVLDGIRFHFKQMLIGDSSDGYKGANKVGPKKVDKLYDEFTDVNDMWPIALEAFQNAGHDDDYALLQAQLSYILRDEADYANGCIRLWTPDVYTQS